MKLLEKLIYSLVALLATYTIVSIALRMFDLTTLYVSHMVGGIASIVVGLFVLMFFMLREEEE